MKTLTEAAEPTPATEPEYEWGVRYETPDSIPVEIWGYKEDPRTTGLIDEDNEIQVGGSYGFLPVLAVGKRPKAPEIWENI